MKTLLYTRQQRLGALLAGLTGAALCLSAQASEPLGDEPPPRASHIADPASDSPADFLGSPLVPGTLERRYWSAGQPLAGLATPTPVLIASGAEPGPTLCLTAAVHGDELNGVEIIRRVVYGIEPQSLRGNVIGVPIVNLHGFRRQSRYLPDRRDLNRYFPGNPEGSAASRIAAAFFSEVISHCDWLIDIHTGSFHRTNLTQLRADLGNSSVVELSRLFGEMVVLHSAGASGTLRKAAVNAGIPAVVIEAGEPLRLQQAQVEQGVRGINSVISNLGLRQDQGKIAKTRQGAVYYQSKWLRADQSGILLSNIKLGATVRKGDLLGTVTDPITNRRTQIHSSHNGQILGMALNQMVMPGFAAYHLGIPATEAAARAAQAADIAADAALEPVREAVTEAAREAAAEAAASSEDPQAVNDAARSAAEKAVSKPPSEQTRKRKAKARPKPTSTPEERVEHPE